MSIESDFDIIRNASLSMELTDDECRVLAGAVHHRLLRDGEVLMREGDEDHRLYVINSGMLAVEKGTGGGETVTLHMHRLGDMVGEMGFIDGAPHSATLRAVGETEVISLEREALEALVDQHPRLVYKVMRVIIRTVHAILRRMNLQFVELSSYITKQYGRGS